MRHAPVWHEAEIRAIRDVTRDVREFELVPLVGRPLAYAPGAHLDVGVLIDGLPQTRSYSLVGEPNAARYRIAVKRVEPSRGGSAYMWRLVHGNRLKITQPKSAFEIDFGRGEYLLVAGGIGVTPIVGMALALARRKARVRMLYGARTAADLAFADELGAALGPALEPVLDSEGKRIDFAAEFPRLAPDAICALCGPMPMLEAARRAWAASGRPAANLRWETFGSSGRRAAESFTVKLPRHGLELTVPANRTLLDTLAEAGVATISDCRKGECGICAMNVLACDGEIDHRDVFFSEAEKEKKDKMCVCVSRAVGTLTLDDDYRPEAA